MILGDNMKYQDNTFYGNRFYSNCFYPVNWNSMRKIVYARANYKCEYCGNVRIGINAHHVLPLSKGGKNELNNLVCICDICHSILHRTNLKLENKSIRSIETTFDLDIRFSSLLYEERKLELTPEISEDEQDFHSIEDNIYDGY